MEEMVKNEVNFVEQAEENKTVEVVASEQEKPKETKAKTSKVKNNLKYIPSVLCVIVGLIIAITGMVQLFAYKQPSTRSTFYEYYGGDAYTGMQQASADASINAKEAAGQAYNLVKCVYTLTIFFGLFVIVFGLLKAVDTSLKISVIDNTEANLYCQIERDLKKE